MNKKQPKVSVVVPCYNVEKYLPQCMDSIINQTIKDIEIICVNDGSTDSTLRILQKYAEKDKRIKIIDKANSGYGASMNKGFSEANGEYLGIVESDDWVEPDMFENLYNLAKSNDVDVVKSNFYFYWSKPFEKNELFEAMPKSDVNKKIVPIKAQGVLWSAPAIWSAIYRNSFICKNNIKFLETAGASYQDTSFNIKSLSLAKSAYLTDKAYLHYRQDNEQSSVKSNGKVFAVCDEYNEIERYLKEKCLFDELGTLIQRLKFATYFWNFNRLKYPSNFIFLKQMSREFKKANQLNLIDKNLFDHKLYKRVKKIIKHPILFFISYQFNQIKHMWR